jgi:hypothetical protein
MPLPRFAYGHANGAGASIWDLGGRGFASQELLEELASASDLSARVSANISLAPSVLREGCVLVSMPTVYSRKPM